jgi:hypothetical protein
MWEAEIKRITVPGHPRLKEVLKTSSQEKKLSMMAGACHPNYCKKHK